MGRTIGWGNGFTKLQYMINAFGLLIIKNTFMCKYKSINAICKKCFRNAPLLELTEYTSLHIAFTQMHIFSTAWCKNLCKFTQITTLRKSENVEIINGAYRKHFFTYRIYTFRIYTNMCLNF